MTDVMKEILTLGQLHTPMDHYTCFALAGKRLMKNSKQ